MCGALEVTDAYEFILFGAMYVTKPHEFHNVWGHGCHQIRWIYKSYEFHNVWGHVCHRSLWIYSVWGHGRYQTV